MKLIIETMELVADDYTSTTGEMVVTAASKLQLSDYTDAIIANLIERDISLKAAQKYRVKKAAKTKIEAMNWRVERAEERAITGAIGETLMDVLLAREAIRQASNTLEDEIDAMENEADIRAAKL